VLVMRRAQANTDAIFGEIIKAIGAHKAPT
jgi:hypothetical protein